MSKGWPVQDFASEGSSNPIFVVGQPRSGSTVMTRLLNEGSGLFVINDFYILQQIDGANLWGQLTSEQASQIAHWIFARIKIRATEALGKTISQSIDLSLDALDSLELFVTGPWDDGLTWDHVLEATVTRAARLAGCSRWGYNTPQDHLHLGRLFRAFPRAKVIFVLRHPEAVLKSYKNVSGPWHDRRRYNPISIGWAWRVAALNYLKWRDLHREQVVLVRYEDLVNQTTKTVERLSLFLETTFPEIDLEAFGENSSFGHNRIPSAVSGTEVWLGERAAGLNKIELGFERSNRKPLFSDVPEVSRDLLRSSTFIVGQILFNVDRRRRALRFFRGR